MYQIAIHRAIQISEANRRRKRQVNVTKWHNYGCNSKNDKSLAKGDTAKLSIAKKIVLLKQFLWCFTCLGFIYHIHI
jgi:hypothetical protein